MVKKLPARPSLDQLKHQAKDLLHGLKEKNPEALNRFRLSHPHSSQGFDAFNSKKKLSLSDAQWVIALEYGYASWPKLKRAVEHLSHTFDEKVARFLEASTDGRTGVAASLLSDEPEIAHANIFTLAVVGDVERMRACIDKNPDCVQMRGGVHKTWAPLHYLSHSHLHKLNATLAEGILATAELLLQKGADPNLSYAHPLWPDSTIAPLYGACGESNHVALARILLQAGAEVNDGESMYHAAEKYNLECMELLMEYGADIRNPHEQWSNHPLYFLMGWRENRREWNKVRQGIEWLLEHGADPNVLCDKVLQESTLHYAVRENHSVATLQLLFAKGADPNLPRKDGKTPYHLALMKGKSEVIELFKAEGAQEPKMNAKDAFIAACFRGETTEAQRILTAHPNLMGDLDSKEKLSLVHATSDDNYRAVETMLEVGFDIREKGSEEWGCTPLHDAAWKGNHEIVALLLKHGAPLDVPANPPVPGTPLAWAAHGSKHCYIERPESNYLNIVEAMIAAGAQVEAFMVEEASVGVAEVLKKHLTNISQDS